MISLLFFIFLNISIGLLMGITPYINRRDIPFGVSIPVTDKTKEVVNAQKKSYLFINLGIAIIINIGIFLYGQFKPNISEEKLVYLCIVSLFIMLGISLVSYVLKHNELKKYKQTLSLEMKQTKKIVVNLSFRDEKLIFPTSYLVGINLAFVLVTVLLTVFNYQNIPDKLVTQWDFNMNPTTITEKTWGSVMMIPAMQVFITIVMAISNQAYLSAKQQIDGKNPTASSTKSKKFRRQSSLLNLVISILTQLLFVAIQLVTVFESISPKVVMILSLVFTILIIGLVLWFSLYYGQSGDRLKTIEINEEEAPKGNIVTGDDDENWKLGMFYFNKQDPSFWVEKRMGVGMTFNFAKWQSWAFLIGVIVLPLLLVFLFM
ncbi:DUF1648 domain-containing protein [Vagococcus fluvialis]|uniref:DUF1648 domain-containing protein n=1 Tax=Vagococcus fluvialis TaxID=2738 RepID=UPI001D0BAF71|nr:DUF5808 domain-containing protein [Vagococcus fluvialis]MCM2138450.1 DUF5808 domain-containing protein [Vagococcus fluvialis]UDM71532.1 DUF5808 domain-containing protein [Vagococcus fluvialis]UDM76393.1 DUF5808 domain-containing protein [Vagococcus fluvialis]UDM83224.1 DUF5808 domain-containing protein [Vagococcus fluvialis]